MSTYEYDMHDLGMSTFQSIQAQALRAENSKVYSQEAARLRGMATLAAPGEQAALMADAAQYDQMARNVMLGQPPTTTVERVPAPTGQPAPDPAARDWGRWQWKKWAIGAAAIPVAVLAVRFFRNRRRR